MQIMVNVTITDDDNYSLTLDEAASAVLAALGGDPAKDVCRISVMGNAAVGPPQANPAMTGMMPPPVNS